MTLDATEIGATEAVDGAAVARQIAAEVRHAASHGGGRTAKVTGLLNAFGVSGSPASLTSVLTALDREDIHVESGWPDIQRIATARLSLKPGSPVAHDVDGDPTIRMSAWSQGRPAVVEVPVPQTVDRGLGDVLWFNVDPPRDESLESRIAYVVDRLQDWCPGLNGDMARDLLDQDVQPKVETYGSEGSQIRSVSAVAVVARELPDHGEEDGLDQQVIFQMVETLVGPGWMISCWHSTRVFARTGHEVAGDPMLRTPFLRHVAHRWITEESRSDAPKTSGDLGIYLTRSLVDTYRASHRMMERWVAAWETDFYQSLNGNETAARLKESAAELSAILSMNGEVRRRLKAFEHGRETTSDKSWFPHLSDYDADVEPKTDRSEQARKLGLSVRAACESFAAVDHDVRADMDLLMLHSQAVAQDTTERMQSYLGKVTGLILVPTFVAGFFGAYTKLPGGASWMGFDLMMVLMVGGAIAVYLAMRRMEK
ncbi:MAG: hypothetical protein JWM40_771 [Frankiales bacterium]|nr:hypothetical protein [Frankiales bacterium]